MNYAQKAKDLLSPRTRALLRNAAIDINEAAGQLWLRLTRGRQLEQVPGYHLLVQLGCGGLAQPGWVNVDKFPAAPGIYYADLAHGLPLRPGSVRHIHCEHFLEHIEYTDARNLLKHCWRVLEPGGSLRLIVPDAGKYMRAYVEGDSAFFAQLENCGGAQEKYRTPMEIINKMFRMDGAHRFAWDHDTLALALRDAGFSRSEASTMGAAPAGLAIDGQDHWRLVESLYLNAYK